MDNQLSSKVPFNSNMTIAELTFPIDTVATMPEGIVDNIVDTFNTHGAVVLECAPRHEPKENLLALAPFFGRVVPHNRSDRHGILPVNALKPVSGFIDSTDQEHPLHTDGSFKDNPEKVTALQCVVPAQTGGSSLLASGKLAHDQLANCCPQDLCQLYDKEAVTIQRNEQCSTKPVFKWEGKRVTMCFRKDETAQTLVKSAAKRGYTQLNEIMGSNVVRFNLMPHQILIVDNLSLVHGREAFSGANIRRYNRLNFDGDGLLDLHYGFQPDDPGILSGVELAP